MKSIAMKNNKQNLYLIAWGAVCLAMGLIAITAGPKGEYDIPGGNDFPRNWELIDSISDSKKPFTH